MKIYFDTEFTGLHQRTKLISIGLIDENGRAFYAETTDYDCHEAYIDEADRNWLMANIISNLGLEESEDMYRRMGGSPSDLTLIKGSIQDIVEMFIAWIEPYDEIVMYSDLYSYDWVLFCEMFGGANEVPGKIHYIPMDLCTMLYAIGEDPDISREGFSDVNGYNFKHNALFDAIVIKKCFEKIDRI